MSDAIIMKVLHHYEAFIGELDNPIPDNVPTLYLARMCSKEIETFSDRVHGRFVHLIEETAKEIDFLVSEEEAAQRNITYDSVTARSLTHLGKRFPYFALYMKTAESLEKLNLRQSSSILYEHCSEKAEHVANSVDHLEATKTLTAKLTDMVGVRRRARNDESKDSFQETFKAMKWESSWFQSTLTAAGKLADAGGADSQEAISLWMGAYQIYLDMENGLVAAEKQHRDNEEQAVHKEMYKFLMKSSGMNVNLKSALLDMNESAATLFDYYNLLAHTLNGEIENSDRMKLLNMIDAAGLQEGTTK